MKFFSVLFRCTSEKKSDPAAFPLIEKSRSGKTGKTKKLRRGRTNPQASAFPIFQTCVRVKTKMVEITGKLISWTSHRSAQRIFTKYAPLFKRDVGIARHEEPGIKQPFVSVNNLSKGFFNAHTLASQSGQ